METRRPGGSHLHVHISLFRPFQIFQCVCMWPECWELEWESEWGAEVRFSEIFPNKLLYLLQFSLFTHHTWSKCRKSCPSRRHVTIKSTGPKLFVILKPTADRNCNKNEAAVLLQTGGHFPLCLYGERMLRARGWSCIMILWKFSKQIPVYPTVFTLYTW